MRIKESPAHPLAQIGTAHFLQHYWGQRPLVVRQALPSISAPLTRDALFALAQRDDVDARLVSSFAQKWRMRHGPITGRPRQSKDWTLLVNGVNLYDDAADRLLQRFAFVPYTRLDDLMISYAVPGGGVGPHFDSYDVFLIQVEGKRRWRYGRQRNLRLREDLPLKILERFEPEFETILEPGDMLYLPPQIAHDGVALDECMTCSIGFRAPSANEVLREFLFDAADSANAEGLISERVDAPTKHPAALSNQLIEAVADLVTRARFSKGDIRRFTGRFFSEPKQEVVFDPPNALSPAPFASRSRKLGVRLDPRSRLLYAGKEFFMNGEIIVVEKKLRAPLAHLADRRALDGASAQQLLADAALAEVVYDWYRAGWIHVGKDYE